MESGPEDITRMLNRMSEGNKEAVDSLVPLIYKELKRLAQSFLNRENKEITFNATALVHEAYFKLVDQRSVNWKNRNHFFAIAAQAMRRILINYAIKKKAEKRRCDLFAVTISEEIIARDSKPESLIALDEALNRLSSISERQTKIIELWFFIGLNHREIAEALDISEPTVRRDWRLARAWLSREMNKII